MQQEWDERARENARFYICTDIPHDEATFFASGARDYDRHVRPFLRVHSFAPSAKVALEIGCGIGRMTRCFALEFAEVVGVDVSQTMIEHARSSSAPRARFLVGSGQDLAGVEDRSVDFAFSFIVFQHIPEKGAILRYIEEAGRVLREGGLFRFHLNGLPHLEIQGILLEGYISESPRLRRFGLSKLPLIRRRHLDTWLGYPISLRDVVKACRGSSLELLEVTGRWTTNMWVSGRKRAALR